MARENIYKKALQSLIDGKLTKGDVWDIMHEHFDMLDDDNKKLQKNIDEYREKYQHLLKQVNEVHKEHEKEFNQYLIN